MSSASSQVKCQHKTLASAAAAATAVQANTTGDNYNKLLPTTKKRIICPSGQVFFCEISQSIRGYYYCRHISSNRKCRTETQHRIVEHIPVQYTTLMSIDFQKVIRPVKDNILGAIAVL